MKRRMKRAEEYDVYTAWRRLLCWTQRPGATSAVKRRTRRRERREGTLARDYEYQLWLDELRERSLEEE